eukprot:Skav222088  [mRNA]  locus=scaffold2165:132804:134974:- [translate_table: standard]
MTTFICSPLQNSPIWSCTILIPLLLLRLLFGSHKEVCANLLKASLSNAFACKRACRKAYYRITAQVRQAWECLVPASHCDDRCSQASLASLASLDDDRGLCLEVQESDDPSLLEGEQGVEVMLAELSLQSLPQQ